MSGLDVEALLDSTATDVKAKDSLRNSDDRHRSERLDRREKDKYRDGSRDRDRDRKRRDRSRDREHHRDRDEELKSPRSEHGSANGSHRSSKRKSRSRDREDDRRRSKRDDGHHRRRSRSPEPDRYYRPGGRSSRDEEDSGRRDRNGDREKERRRSASPRKRVKSKTPEPQLTEDERDRRTIFVQQLATRLRTKELTQFFEKVGPVNEAQIVKDRVSGRSKGQAFKIRLSRIYANADTVWATSNLRMKTRFPSLSR